MQLEEAKVRYADTVERKKAYIRNNSVYIENKRKRIGLNESDSLADLCFALEMKDRCNILMFEDVIDLIIQPIQKDQFELVYNFYSLRGVNHTINSLIKS